MEDQIISFKTAVLAKKKRFDSGRLAEYYYCEQQGRKFHTQTNLYTKEYQQDRIAFAFTQSLLQRWLREVHDIRVLIDFETIDDSETAYTFKIVKYLPEGKNRKKDTWDFYETTYSFNQGGGWYKTYEEALELGLIEGLKLIK